MPKPPIVFPRTVTVLLCTVLQICFGTVYAWSFFQTLLVQDYGWTLTQTAIAFSIVIFSLGLSAAWAGMLLPKNCHVACLLLQHLRRDFRDQLPVASAARCLGTFRSFDRACDTGCLWSHLDRRQLVVQRGRTIVLGSVVGPHRAYQSVPDSTRQPDGRLWNTDDRA